MFQDRVAGAPISWGVCEVPGWGYQMSPDRVLTEMREVGLVATEFGPDGFLPNAPEEKASLLASYGLSAVGGFVPVVLHERSSDVLATLAPTLEAFVAAKAGILVLSADSGLTGYDERVVLDAEQWQTLFANLDRIRDAAGERGIVATLHPHVGTLVEKTEDVTRVLEGSTIPLCVDTGHLLIGGIDPARPGGRRPGPCCPHPPQGRRRRASSAGAGRRTDLHPGGRPGNVPPRSAAATWISPASCAPWKPPDTPAGT